MKSFVFLLFFTFSLYAHPHVFIDVYPKIETTSIKLRWVFDEMTSNMLILDYDSNHDDKISTSENEVLRKNIFLNFKKYGYYTYFYKGKKKLPFSKAKNFTASIEESKLVFTFSLSRDSSADAIHFYDSENYTGYVVEEEYVNEVNPKHKYKVDAHEFDYFYGYILELK